MVELRTWEDLNSVERIYKAIRNYELEYGEDFIDQNESIVKDIPFATWLVGKGYMSSEKLNLFLELNGSLQDLLGGYDEPYCIFPYGQGEIESNYKKYHLLSEYIFIIEFLKKRLFKCLREDLEDGEVLVLDDSLYEETSVALETVHNEWLWVIDNTIEEVNRILIKRKNNR